MTTAPSPASFPSPRRRRPFHALRRAVTRGGGPRALLPLDEAERRLRPFARHYVGVREIPVDGIVGTDGRGADFDREFLPRRPDVAERRRRLERAFPEGGFPPIVAYRLGDAYFVVDGHHRVALARQRGMGTIDADVTELRARWHLRADADLVELVHADQQRFFLDESGLGDTDEPVRFSSPAAYVELLENVQIHGYHQILDGGRLLGPGEVAADWYERVYAPVLAAIRAEGLDRLYPDATPADLYLHVYRRRRASAHELGCPPLDGVVRELAEEERRRRRPLSWSRRDRLAG